MTENLPAVLTTWPLVLAALACGLLAGAAYFAAVWLSARAALSAASPWRALLAGGALRLGAVLAGLWALLAAGIDPVLMLAAMLGFLVARTLATLRGRASADR